MKFIATVFTPDQENNTYYEIEAEDMDAAIIIASENLGRGTFAIHAADEG